MEKRPPGAQHTMDHCVNETKKKAFQTMALNSSFFQIVRVKHSWCSKTFRPSPEQSATVKHTDRDVTVNGEMFANEIGKECFFSKLLNNLFLKCKAVEQGLIVSSKFGAFKLYGELLNDCNDPMQKR